MKKVFWQILVIAIFLLTACGQSTSVTQTTPIPVIDNATSTPSPIPTATRTTLPTATPTASVTPLPTSTPTAHLLSISTNNVQVLRQIAMIKGYEDSPDVRGVNEIKTFQNLDFSIGGFLIAVEYSSGDIRLFDASTLTQVHQFKGGPAFAISLDKKLIATVIGYSIQVWDISTGKLIKEIDFGDAIDAIEFDKDSKRLIAQGFAKTKTWSTFTWELTDNSSGLFLSLYPLTQDPSILVYPGNGIVIIQDALTSDEMFTLPPAPSEMMPEYYTDAQTDSIAYSSDGNLFADAKNYGWISIWNLKNEQLLHILLGHETVGVDGGMNGVYDIAFAPYGSLLASTGVDGTIRLWDANTGDSLRVIDMGHSMSNLAFSPDGRYLLAGDFEGNVYIFSIDQ